MAEGAWRDKGRNLFGSGLLDRAIVVLEAARERSPEDPGIGKRLVDAYRALGNLAAAANLVSKLAKTSGADGQIQYLDDMFSGRATWPDAVDADEVASPFVVVDDFLPPAVFERIRQSALALLPHVKRAPVSERVETATSTLRVDEGVRRSWKLPNPSTAVQLLQPRLNEILTASTARLGLETLVPGRIEFELGVYRDGDFFARHQDLYESSRSRRAVSFVFFCSAMPRLFEGGDLLLYDLQRSRAESTSLNFTRIEPLPNRLVLFNPSTSHEVTPVHCPSDRPDSLRYTVTGWVHEARPA